MQYIVSIHSIEYGVGLAAKNMLLFGNYELSHPKGRNVNDVINEGNS